MKRSILPLFLLFALNLADVHLTIQGLNIGAAELNPFFMTHNLTVKIALPIVFGTAYVLTVHYSRKEELQWPETVVKGILYFLIFLYTIIVTWNLLGVLTVSLA